MQLPRELLVTSTPIPVYYRLAEQIRQLIDHGVMQQGERLPSEGRIAEHLHVSRSTVRKALYQLQQAGLVRREHPGGTFVNQIPDHDPRR